VFVNSSACLATACTDQSQTFFSLKKNLNSRTAHLLNAIQDKAVGVHGLPETDVFGPA
jgi:hypothetical protein